MSPWIDPETGEMGECPRCKTLEQSLDGYETHVRGLQMQNRSWMLKEAQARRESERKTLPDNHPHREDAEIAFKEWRKRCNHPRSQFTASRFWLVAPILENPQYGLKIVLQAIAGAEYDAYVVRRKNGTKKRFDMWEEIFKDTGSLEEFASKAPGMGPALRAVA